MPKLHSICPVHEHIQDNVPIEKFDYKIANGNLVSVLPVDKNEGLHYRDFSVESLIENGVSDLLRPSYPLSPSAFAISDSVDVIDSNLGDFDINTLNESKSNVENG